MRRNLKNLMACFVGTGVALALAGGVARAQTQTDQTAEIPAPPPAATAPAAAPAQTPEKTPAPLTPEQQAEMDRILACDRQLCGMVLKPSETGGANLKCDITKTWVKDQIAEAWAKTRVSWPFGDARCSVKSDLPRGLLTAALTNKKYTLKVPAHTVSCEVDNGGTRYPMTAVMAPEVVFADGKATSVSLGVGKIEGNAVIKSAVWTTTRMISMFGLFQEDFKQGVNDYIGTYCAQTYGTSN